MAFLIVIECGENSYSISKKGIDQSQQIALSRLEWVELIRLCGPVTSYMRGETLQSKKEEEISWSLATENSSGVEAWITVSTKSVYSTLKEFRIATSQSTRVHAIRSGSDA